QAAFSTVFERDAAAVALCDGLDQREAKTGAAGLGVAGGLEPHEGLEHTVLFALWNAGAFVLDENLVGFGRFFELHLGAAAVMHGVLDKIAHGAPNLVRPAGERGRAVGLP